MLMFCELNILKIYALFFATIYMKKNYYLLNNLFLLCSSRTVFII